jgi:hypothetical protein
LNGFSRGRRDQGNRQQSKGKRSKRIRAMSRAHEEENREEQAIQWSIRVRKGRHPSTLDSRPSDVIPLQSPCARPVCKPLSN